MIRKERLYLGWRWSQASGAVARERGAGRPAVARNTIGVAEVLWLGSDGLFSAKKRTYGLN